MAIQIFMIWAEAAGLKAQAGECNNTPSPRLLRLSRLESSESEERGSRSHLSPPGPSPPSSSRWDPHNHHRSLSSAIRIMMLRWRHDHYDGEISCLTIGTSVGWSFGGSPLGARALKGPSRAYRDRYGLPVGDSHVKQGGMCR